MGAAFEDYLAGLSPVVQRLAALATRLGAGAAGAAGAIVDSDSEATRLLGQTGHRLGAHGSELRRPITG